MIDAMKQAMYLIEAWERGAYAEEYPNEIAALRQAIEQAEKQEPDLPPVFIGVDVTLKGTQVNAFYRRPNDVAEMFYSEFHPLAKPEQEPVAYLCENAVGYKYLRWKKPTSHYKPIALYTAPPRKEWVGLTELEIKHYNSRLSGSGVAQEIEAKLREKNGG